MIIDDFALFSKPCFRDYPPPCNCACPLGVDVRALVDKIQRGNFTSAYRIYRNHVVFPGIVSEICSEPCRQVCVRINHDQAVFLRKLEASCVALAEDKNPIQYNVPRKPFTVAVVGAGLSGLACALKLAGRNYTVRIYDRNDSWGGRLREILPESVYMDELRLQFSQVECDKLFSTEIMNLDDLKADAVYIATGRGGTDFGLLETTDINSLGTARTGFFLGGGLLGADPIQALEHGIRASFSIEKYLKVGAMDGVPETYARPEVKETYYRLPVDRIDSKAAELDRLGRDEALSESRRCLLCNCSQCRDNCEMMKHFKTFPPKITTDIISSLNVIERLTERVAQRLVNSCNQCGACRESCPEKVDMENCILQARRFLHQDGSLPPAFHDFWLRDMEQANTEGFVFYRPPSYRHHTHLFFPGCQLGASDPEYVIKTYKHLLSKYPDTALLVSCCGVPADWAGIETLRDEVIAKLKSAWLEAGSPKIIIACPTCRKTLARYFPDGDQISLYEFLAELEPPEPVSKAATEAYIFDPCASREDEAMQRGVRDLARRCGISMHEPEPGKGHSCCGFGGQMYAANPALAEAIALKRISQSEEEYITCCTNCRDIFARAGKPARHILDIMFTGNSSDRKPPSLSRRRLNRIILSAAMTPAGQAEAPKIQEEKTAMKLVVSEELRLKMDRLLILEEDAAQAVLHCEESGCKILDQGTGLYTGHLKIGIITYWVTYASSEDSFVLHNIYAHRMVIEE